MPALILEEEVSPGVTKTDCLFESSVILDYLARLNVEDRKGLVNKRLEQAEGETRRKRDQPFDKFIPISSLPIRHATKLELLIRVHDMYISGPNVSSQCVLKEEGYFGGFSTQAVFYKPAMPVAERK